MKLFRVALLLPAVLVISMLFRSSAGAGGKRPPLLPSFLVGFAILVALNSFITVPKDITDAVQAACWLDLRTITPHVDLLSLSGHKFGGPKGVGVLVARTAGTFDPLIIGGGQERERRSGTQNVAGAVALAEALRLADIERDHENARLTVLRDRLVGQLRACLPNVRETVDPMHKVAGSAHVCIRDIENEALLYMLDEGNVCASAASACAAGAMEPSHVLAAMGVERQWAAGAVRLTLGRTTTDADVDRAIEVIVGAVQHIRGFAA